MPNPKASTRQRRTTPLRGYEAARDGDRSRSVDSIARDCGPVVYFLRTKDDLIKIGTTTRAFQRVPMQTSWDGLLVLYPGSYDEESSELARFTEHVSRGREYHHPAPAIFDRVDQIRAGYGLSKVKRWGHI